MLKEYTYNTGNIRIINETTGEYVDLILNKNNKLYTVYTPEHILDSQVYKALGNKIARNYLIRSFPSKNNFELYFRKVFNASRVERLSNKPKNWRHCCNKIGITIFNPTYININGTNILYIYCFHCKSVLYYVDEN